MATVWKNFKGYLEWPMVYEPDDFQGDKRWKVNLVFFDDSEYEKFKLSGLQMVPKENSDGKKYVSFRRSFRKVFPKDDEATYFTPPTIRGAVNVQYVDEEGKPVKSYKKSEGKKVVTVGEQVAIGNGSLGVVNVAIFEAQNGKGHRLEGVEVIDLVGFTPESKEVRDAKVEDKKTEIAKDMNDSLPW